MLAILFLAAMIMLVHLKVAEIVVQLVTITGWVFMWEAVYTFFLRRQALKFKLVRQKAF